VLIIILLAAFAVRLDGTSWRAFWFDEGLSVAFASRPLPQLIETLIREDLHPPLYYLSLHFWMALVGHSEFAVRYLSVGLGVLLVALTFATARTLYPQRQALVVALPAAALVAFSPFLLYYSQEARMYMLAANFALAAVITLLKGVAPVEHYDAEEKDPARTHWWIAHALAVAGGLYTIYFSAFLLPALFLYILLFDQRWLGRWLGAMALAAFLFLPWLLPAYWQMQRLLAFPDFWPAQLNPSAVMSQIVMAFLGGSPSVYLLIVIGLVIAIALVMIMRSRPAFFSPQPFRRERNGARREALLVLAFIIPIALTSAVVSIFPKFAARYAIVGAAPLYLSALVVAYAVLWQRTRAARLAYIALAAVTIVAFYRIAPEAARSTWDAHENPRAAAAYLNERVAPDDMVLLLENAPYAFIQYYHGAAPWRGIHVGQDFSAGADALNQVLAAHPARVWVLLWHNEFADPSDLVLTELARRGQLVDRRDNLKGYGVRAFAIEDYTPVQPWPVPQTHLNANFANRFVLDGFDVVRRDPGVRMYIFAWRRTQPVRHDVSLVYSLRDRANNEYLRGETALSTFYYVPVAWPTNVPVRGRLSLTLPSDLPPRDYQLIIRVYDLTENRDLDVLDATGSPAGRELVIDRFTVTKSDLAQTPIQIPHLVDHLFAGGLRLLGYGLESDSIRPGDSVHLDLWWQKEGETVADPLVRIEITDNDGQAVLAVTQPPVEGYAMSRWAKRETNREIVRVTIPADFPPGAYRLRAVVNDDIAPIASFRVLEQPRPVVPSAPEVGVHAQFGEAIQLLASEMHVEGDTLFIVLYWQATHRIETSYKVTVQALRDGRLIAQDDSIPVNWTYPTTAWIPGEIVRDEHRLALPPALGKENDQIIMALYDEQTSVRIAVTQDGQTGDHVVLGEASR